MSGKNPIEWRAQEILDSAKKANDAAAEKAVIKKAALADALVKEYDALTCDQGFVKTASALMGMLGRFIDAYRMV